ncbi:MAG: sensor histidine kinase [Vicinamibacteria bacterium]
MKANPWPAGWLTAIAATAVVGVNAAGLWGIAVAYRGAREEEVRLFAAEIAARARSLESVLSTTRAEMAFLSGSSAISGLGVRPLPLERGKNWQRLAAEAALLVFHRGHPEVKRLVVKSGKDDVIVETARRGGVPVLWMPQDRAGTEAQVPEGGGRPAVRAVFAFDSAAAASREVVRVVAEIDPNALLGLGASVPEGTLCALRDGTDRPLTTAAAPAAGGSDRPVAEVQLRADGWSVPSPWVLSCARERAGASIAEPIAARSRTLLLLNIAVMALAGLLGSFAIREVRRRERLEAEAREEARVRDLERQLFHAERLGTVGRLAAGIAHEINNPLEGIANYLALARDHAGNGAHGSLAQDLDGIRQGLDRAAGIVQRVLAHAEPASAPHAPVDLTAAVRETLDFVRSRQEFRDIAFVADLPDGPLVAPGSAVMLGQVLLNLAINACEAQPQGGEVRASAAREGDDVVVRIADRGPGVPEAERHRIFEPFFTTKQSTGLGLSVCHSIVTQHRGQLSVEERAGGGAVFVLRLPASESGASIHGR